MGIYKSLAGQMTAELTSADIPGSLKAINDRGIQIFDVQLSSDLTAQFGLYRKDLSEVLKIAQKRGDWLRISKKKGLYWNVKGLLQRPILVLGMSILIFLMLFVPSRVLFVQVEGNVDVPTRLILAAAEESGICFGASRREVRSERVKNALLSAVPELQWAGVNTFGCTAVISVRERSIVEETEKSAEVSSIVAVRSGVILSCTVTQGNGLCTVGQAVQEGEVLISGYTDCGLCITATRAEGEIMAQTRRDLTVKTPAQAQNRGTVTSQTVKYSLQIGKKRINFYKGSGISDGSCVKMYSEYCLTLPGGFQLPVMLVKETIIGYDCTDSEIIEEHAAADLSGFAADYLHQQMIAGRITEQTEQISFGDGVWCLTGQYACTEMIGRRQEEQIGEYHETN